jgi:hypothetical protein
MPVLSGPVPAPPAPWSRHGAGGYRATRPAAAVEDPTPVPATVPAGHLTVAQPAARVIAAAGLLDLPTLVAAITRTRRFRSRIPCRTAISSPR